MAEIAKQEDVKEVLVRTNDGAVWQAEIIEGVTYLVKQITPPPPTPSSEPSEAEPEGSPEPAEGEEGSGEGSGSAKPEEGEGAGAGKPGEDIFGDIDPETTLDEFIDGIEGAPAGGHGAAQKIAPRADQPKTVSPMPDRVKEKLKDNAFRSRLSSVMLDNKYDRKLKGRTRGKLDMTRLFKVPTQARNVFTQKKSRRGKQYNVLLLVDESGSMDGSKARTAAECAVFLAKNFEGININVAIIGFNHYVTVRKEFGTPCDYDRVYRAIATMNWNSGHGDNNDYDAMLRGYKMFDHAPSGENIMIMLSDGFPAPSHAPEFIDIKGEREDANKYKHKLRRGETAQKVHLHHLVNSYKDRVTSIGIGIQEGGWQIPEHFVVDDVNHLKPKLIEVLNKKIKRG